MKPAMEISWSISKNIELSDEEMAEAIREHNRVPPEYEIKEDGSLDLKAGQIRGRRYDILYNDAPAGKTYHRTFEELIKWMEDGEIVNPWKDMEESNGPEIRRIKKHE